MECVQLPVWRYLVLVGQRTGRNGKQIGVQLQQRCEQILCDVVIVLARDEQRIERVDVRLQPPDHRPAVHRCRVILGDWLLRQRLLFRAGCNKKQAEKQAESEGSTKASHATIIVVTGLSRGSSRATSV